MKNIVVITGSPRKGGNSDLMADAFIKAAGGNGHEITKIAAAELNIGGCRACEGCYTTDAPCVFKDDFNMIAPAIERADVIVFASPLYWFSFSAQIKNIIDRFYSLIRGPKPFKGTKECILLASGAGEMEDFTGMIKTYEIMADYLGFKDLGKVIAEGVSDKGDVKDTGALESARQLGESI